jgi:hypothetical protein
MAAGEVPGEGECPGSPGRPSVNTGILERAVGVKVRKGEGP